MFSYYPAQVSVAPTSPPVYFAPGGNAGSPDLGSGNTITLTLGTNGSSGSITIHPTYQVTYYKNVTVIVNSDTKAYNVYIRVTSPITLPTGSGSAIGTSPTSGMAKLYIYSKGASRSLTGFPTPAPPSGSYITTINLTATGTTYVGSLSGGGVYEIDIYIYIPEGALLPSSLTASIMLIATPSSETPP